MKQFIKLNSFSDGIVVFPNSSFGILNKKSFKLNRSCILLNVNLYSRPDKRGSKNCVKIPGKLNPSMSINIYRMDMKLLKLKV